jgi:hypothetical protein
MAQIVWTASIMLMMLMTDDAINKILGHLLRALLICNANNGKLAAAIVAPNKFIGSIAQA